MKKWILLLICFGFLLMLVACSSTTSTPTGTATAEHSSHDWDSATGICRTGGELCNHPNGASEEQHCEICGYAPHFEVITTTDIIDRETVFVRFPEEWKTRIQECGKFSDFHYSTNAYADYGYENLERTIRVYTPYGYDKDDTETKYNVIYFIHGNGNSIATLSSAQMRTVFDNIFFRSDIAPCLIVCISYYLDDGKEAAFDGRDAAHPFLFHEELVKDIIPAVESSYNTYLENAEEAGIIASRDHRLISGYSRGSVCTWNLFHYAFPYFQFYMPMSADCLGDNHSAALTNEEAYLYLKEAIDANPNLPFFIYAASGGPQDGAGLREQMKYFVAQTETFSYGTDREVNNIYYTLADYDHNDVYAPYYYFNALPVFWG